MKRPSRKERERLWAQQERDLRDPAQIVSQWQQASETDPRLLQHKALGHWWETLEAYGITLLVTREYEHLLVALRVSNGKPNVSYMRLPHPSGLAVDRTRGIVYVASTRNPNQIFDLMPVTGLRPRRDVRLEPLADRPLVPVRSRFLPGSLYLHDLAIINRHLYACAAGENTIVRLYDDGRCERVWWPRCIETKDGPIFDRNHLQLNSIAAGKRLTDSYFSASTDEVSTRQPGHRNFAVDRRGVIFSGSTREPVARGLTRPHSARLHDGGLWVNNSGYGEVGRIVGQRFEPVARLPGWTRGLCLSGRIAIVGVSRVLPRFRQYAPGLDADESSCGLYAIEIETGKILGSLTWPFGNQIFAVEWAQSDLTTGFPFIAGAGRTFARDRKLFYSFETSSS